MDTRELAKIDLNLLLSLQVLLEERRFVVPPGELSGEESLSERADLYMEHAMPLADTSAARRERRDPKGREAF